MLEKQSTIFKNKKKKQHKTRITSMVSNAIINSKPFEKVRSEETCNQAYMKSMDCIPVYFNKFIIPITP
jgi:ribosomal protein S7